MKQLKKPLISLCLLTSLLAYAGFANAGETPGSSQVAPGIPVQNTVTLVDLGATICIPCKMMAPLLEELKAEYKGRAEVLFIDVYAKPGIAKPFAIRAIPTQIVYDRQGKEVFRHLGFLEKNAMKEQLDQYLAVK